MLSVLLRRLVHASGRTWHRDGMGMDSAARPTASFTKLRVMTYNVHGCVGTDGRHDLERIATVIGESQPDVVALQELDVARPRSGGSHQASRIAELLGMAGHFHPAWLPQSQAPKSLESSFTKRAILQR